MAVVSAFALFVWGVLILTGVAYPIELEHYLFLPALAVWFAGREVRKVAGSGGEPGEPYIRLALTMVGMMFLIAYLVAGIPYPDTFLWATIGMGAWWMGSQTIFEVKDIVQSRSGVSHE